MGEYQRVELRVVLNFLQDLKSQCLGLRKWTLTSTEVEAGVELQDGYIDGHIGPGRWRDEGRAQVVRHRERASPLIRRVLPPPKQHLRASLDGRSGEIVVMRGMVDGRLRAKGRPPTA